MRLRTLVAVLLVAGVGLFVGLESGSVVGQPKAACLYYDQTGRGDLSFNDMAALGAEKGVSEFGLELKEATAGSSADYLPDLQTFARSGECLVIIGVGFLLADALPEAARQFPDQKFAFIDGSSGGIENILGVLFKEQQAAAPIGAAAALVTIADGADAVGYVGGMEIPPVWRLEGGFRFGVHWAMDWYKEIFGDDVEVNILGTYVGRFDDPAGGKIAAETQLAQGATAILGIAGASHLGVFDAVEEAATAERKVVGPPFAFGADASQEYVKPGFVLASARKRVDVGTYTAIKQAYEGTFAGGTDLVLGIAEEGVGFSTVGDMINFVDLAIEAGQIAEADREATINQLLAMRDSVPYFVWEAVFELQSEIASGEIEVPGASSSEEIKQVRETYP